ncbi:hypothetical protein WA026_021801 [Henosepilachna vigintioctopunctata]|uniref:CRAL-TRIO domain-containing protein n=1 Tax=Henosepilachna vigintioctopunctata TaxID=420089 RepID=A0AAW1TY75_9CUCU
MDFTYLRNDRSKVLAFCEKSEQDMKDYFDILRTWMKKQLHIPSELLSDEFLEIYVTKNKFSIEKVKTKIENYCTMKNEPRKKMLLENYSLTPSKEPQFYIPMPELTDDLYRVFIAKVWDEHKYDMASEHSNLLILREFCSRYDYNLGEIYILDLSEISAMQIISKLRVNILAEGVEMILNAHSARIKEVHIINPIGPTLLNLVKPFLPSKIGKRLFIHENADMVSKLVAAKCLPKDYGGDQKSLKEFLRFRKYNYMDGNWKGFLR